MTTYAVTYVYTDDTAALDEHRPEHRAFLRGLCDQGVLRASGPTSTAVATDGTTTAPAGALLALEGESADAVLATLDEDPFWVRGLVSERSVREWRVVIGGFAPVA